MRIVLSLSVLLLATAAAPPAVVTPQPQPRLSDLGTASVDEGVCRDRVVQVRAERGLPARDRGNAIPNEPLLIAAVDQRIDGCAVMVMKNDTSDIRPLPAPKDGPVRLERIPGQ